MVTAAIWPALNYSRVPPLWKSGARGAASQKPGEEL